MHWRWMGWTLGLAGIVAAGCTITQVEGESVGAAGSAGAAGTGGAAGTNDNGACGDVPVSGVCVDEKTLRTCIIPDNADEVEHVAESTCLGTRVCQMSATGVAQCVSAGECEPGAAACSFDSKSVLSCQLQGDQAHWVATPCDTSAGEQCVVGKPGTSPQCLPVPSQSGGTTGPTLTGTIKYQYRPVRADRQGWDNIKTAAVFDAYVTVFGGEDGSEFLGAALSGWDPVAGEYKDDGYFLVELTGELTDTSSIWVWPMVFNYQTGVPLMAVAKLETTNVMDNARESQNYWAFGRSLSATSTQIDMEITEEEGSGAMHIFNWIDYGLVRASAALPGKDQMSVVVYWNPETGTPSCGACFCGTQCGGAQMKYGSTDAETDYYDSWIALGGPPSDGSTEWARSVISHEFGHYLMHNYSLSPGEGGTHYVGRASKPGLAYSEAWATAFGQTNIDSAIYVDEQQGTTFWVDIAKYEYSGGGLELPKASEGIDQHLNENVGAGMIWKLWVQAASDPDGRGLGDEKIFGALTNPQLVNGTYNRGYSKVDLVDFFDAAICSGNATESDVTAVCQTSGFPYDPADKPCQ